MMLANRRGGLRPQYEDSQSSKLSRSDLNYLYFVGMIGHPELLARNGSAWRWVEYPEEINHIETYPSGRGLHSHDKDEFFWFIIKINTVWGNLAGYYRSWPGLSIGLTYSIGLTGRWRWGSICSISSELTDKMDGDLCRVRSMTSSTSDSVKSIVCPFLIVHASPCHDVRAVNSCFYDVPVADDGVHMINLIWLHHSHA